MKLYLLLIAYVFILSSCKKESFEIQNLNNNQVGVLGHAGSGNKSLYPINSAESIYACLYSGASGSEIDIQLTKDNKLVAFHSENLNEVTNLKGKVREFTIDSLSYAYYNSTPFSAYQIMPLRSFFSNEMNKSFTFSLDVKIMPAEGELPETYLNDYAEAIQSLFTEYNLYEHVMIESQNTYLLDLLKNQNEAYQLFIYPQSFDQGLQLCIDHEYKGMSLPYDQVAEQQVKSAHDQGFWVILWAVHNKKTHIDALQKNPDFLLTDDIKNLLKLIN